MSKRGLWTMVILVGIVGAVALAVGGGSPAPEEATPSPAPTLWPDPVAVVISEDAALLECPDVFECERLAIIPAGQSAEMVGMAPGAEGMMMNRVVWDGLEGWVSPDYLDLANE